MFALAILVGIYSYLILGLGILGLLYSSAILIVSVVFVITAYLYFKGKPEDFPRINLRNKNLRPLLFLFLLLAGVNLIGALGPELSFDALWYHLTLPKIFLESRSIDFISGGLFYYSVMPKLSEMLFIPGLVFGNEVIPKLTQWIFGILTSIVIYKISRRYFDEKLSIIGSLIFYGSLVVAWESTTAYVDLIRTFFEVMALWGFLIWFEKKDRKWLVESAIMLGLAISTKLIAIGSLLIFAVVMIYVFTNNKRYIKQFITNIHVYMYISIFISFPWFAYAFLTTGNPLYPIFSDYFPVGFSADLLNPINLLRDFFILFFRAPDPISPIYAIVLPLAFVMFGKFNKQQRVIGIYCLLALIVWYFIPRTGGGRFFLPYLPAFSILTITVLANIRQIALRKYIISLVIFVSLITAIYRGIANAKFVPVILGTQTKNDFLTKNLNFNYGDFYDTDGWFDRSIKDSDKVLLYGFHNLYYVNFPFIHESYVKKGDRFNYIATQNTEIPKRFSYWQLIYENNLTNVKLYSLKGIMWTY
ncbi:MAG: Dolichyl-phosphate-mannose-protein mannosyltransferase protein [Microgenomates group bacterium GW2011_GWA2_37_6]|nr:MAG: Dolichyl-phosphate-mannose-protein mannosyltransferase protein [Microgenomates group bacterium GW2011_GWA2_37_6]